MNIFSRWLKKSIPSKHLQKPFPGEKDGVNQSVLLTKIKELQESHYYDYIQPLKKLVSGKKVIETLAGTSGFILKFSDGTWVITYLQNNQLCWISGDHTIPVDNNHLIQNPEYGDGSSPLQANAMYADEECDNEKELVNSIDQEVSGLAIGSNSFNYCFGDGLELSTAILPGNNGKPVLRVFWEQY